MIAPKDYVGKLMELAQIRRGEFVDMQFLTEARTTITYDLPLAEVHPLNTGPPHHLGNMAPTYLRSNNRLIQMSMLDSTSSHLMAT